MIPDPSSKKNYTLTQEQQVLANKTMDDIVQELLKAKPLVIPDGENLVLTTDASNYAMGAHIFTESGKPVCFFSKVFSPGESNLGASEREALALILSIRKFKFFLGNAPKVKCKTDAQAVSLIKSCKTPKLQRWNSQLAEVVDLSNFEFVWKKGESKDLALADMLSRPMENSEKEMKKEEKPGNVPKREHREFIEWLHNFSHQSTPKMMEIIEKTRPKVPKTEIKRICDEVVFNCEGCGPNLQKTTASKRYQGDNPQATRFLDEVAIDFKGPFKKKLASGLFSKQKHWVFSYKDLFSGYYIPIPVTNNEAATAVRCFRLISTILGLPKSIRMDNGVHFIAREFKEALAKLGVKPKYCLVGNPMSNGSVESEHRRLSPILENNLEHLPSWTLTKNLALSKPR